jgi:hypothetical protein
VTGRPFARKLIPMLDPRDPRRALLAEGSPQALEPAVKALRTEGILAALVKPPAGCGSS